MFREWSIEKKGAYTLVGVWLLLVFAHILGAFLPIPSAGVPERWFWLSGGFSLRLLLSPWRLVTYSLLHWDVWHLLVNILFLLLLGRAFRSLCPTPSSFVWFYLGAALTSTVCYLIGFEIFSRFYPQLTPLPLMGASAIVLALGVSVLCSDSSFRFSWKSYSVPIGWVVGVYLLLLLASSWGMHNVGGHLAHIGGAIWGIAWAWGLRRHRRSLSRTSNTLSQEISRQVSQSGYSSLSPSQKRQLTHRFRSRC